MEYKEIEENVIGWAEDKDLLKYDNRHKQALKMVSEVGELCDALIKSDEDEITDAIGDTVVTLIILAAQTGRDLTECLETAYKVIADRKGETVNGTFIKE